MLTVSCHEGDLTVAEAPRPTPGQGQVLLKVLRTGICGSDLHARHHSDLTADYTASMGYDHYMRSAQHVVMGHEFVGEIVEYGPDTRRRWPVGSNLVALPVRLNGEAGHLTGLSELAPGGYAEYLLVEEALSVPVPDDLEPDKAVFTEPLAVAWHAVQRAEIAKNRPAVVIGCGPIGLAVILSLKAAGVKTVIASDMSGARRDLAKRCGADVVVDPAVTTPWQALEEIRHYPNVAEQLTVSLNAIRKVNRLPLIRWWHILPVFFKLNPIKPPVVFECVGIPGMIDHIARNVPRDTRVVVVGVCMQDDTFFPTAAINNELELRFVLGYRPNEFRDVLRMIHKGTLDPSPLHTGTVGLGGVAGAFETLGSPERHAKILVDPTITGDELRVVRS